LRLDVFGSGTARIRWTDPAGAEKKFFDLAVVSSMERDRDPSH
jgi:hypothetical protein